MNLSKRAEYGLRAMINMGIAEDLGRDRVTVTELADGDNLPLKFVEQILLQLRESGYVDAKRGKFGGYFLARDAKTIRMGDLVRLLDGPLAPISCASQTAYHKCSCPDETHCGLRMIMIDVRNAVSNILDRYTLADVVEVTLRKIRRDGAGHYFLKPKAAEEADSPQGNAADASEGFLAGLLEGSKR
jgi:Rrf2 family protein